MYPGRVWIFDLTVKVPVAHAAGSWRDDRTDLLAACGRPLEWAHLPELNAVEVRWEHARAFARRCSGCERAGARFPT